MTLTTLQIPQLPKSTEVRSQLIDALELDLIGPTQRVLQALGDEGTDLIEEKLKSSPSNWYQTGFLIPSDTPLAVRADDTGDDDFAGLDGQDLSKKNKAKGAGDDTGASETGSARKVFLPASIGLSFLLPAKADLQVTARWADYIREPVPGDTNDEIWVRSPREETIELTSEELSHRGLLTAKELPNSSKLKLHWHVRRAPEGQGYPAGSVAVSLFFTNECKQHGSSSADRDAVSAFQVELELHCPAGFIERIHHLHQKGSDDWDAKVNALQYRDALEYGIGHNVSVDAEVTGPQCHTLRTTWLPQATVEKVKPSTNDRVGGIELSMEELDQLATTSAEAVQAQLLPLVSSYRAWIEQQRQTPDLKPDQWGTADQLLRLASSQADRIERGIRALADDQIRDAFAIANRVMAVAARRRFGPMQQKRPDEVDPPQWRPFQLAFVLMNLRAIAHPSCGERQTVDLLFFPTGGGKTEAYLGLAAFTLVIRRLRHDGGPQSGGMSVLMRYTLRLLTLDQLGRASTLICALELERQKQPAKLGSWPFEIGLWVGKSGTPNKMGNTKDQDESTARIRVRKYDGTGPKPIPIDNCPWCGVEFGKLSLTDERPGKAKEVFKLLRNGVVNNDNPDELRVCCRNRDCHFSGDNHLPLVAVDDMIYRRLPAFIIATIDKFASLPWLGRTGKLFGKVSHISDQAYYGPSDGAANIPALPELKVDLDAPDLIIQDELHLISGPLGSMAGLYEAVIDELCSREVDGQTIRPKIVASTATVRRAEQQMRALFGRSSSSIFPAPGPDRRDSFFAYTATTEEAAGRTYVGISAPGRNVKALLLRAMIALMSSAQLQYKAAEKQRKAQEKAGQPKDPNPVDPYMTLLGYFNTIKELGITRRLVEEEVTSRLSTQGQRQRVDEEPGRYANRKIANEPLELTSRVSTSEVSNTKSRLELSFDDKQHVDVALATNMISVGLDITRLGLMLMLGQPKTTAEYIQASSRVGRDESKPGLVVVLLNPNRPRDRSHYEHFSFSHDVFYRDVEATSVTPYSERALERALPAVTVALARHLSEDLSWAKHAAAGEAIAAVREEVAKRMEARVAASGHNDAYAQQVGAQLRRWIDDWRFIAEERDQLQYGNEEPELPALLHTPLDPALEELEPVRQQKFVANWSLRDVEPSAALLATQPGSSQEASA